MEPQPVRPLDYATPPKRNNTKLILLVVGIGVLALVLLCGVAGLYWFSEPLSARPLKISVSPGLIAPRTQPSGPAATTEPRVREP
jgi:hypothetical protein